MSDTARAKQALREQVLARRAGLRPVNLEGAARALRDVLLATPEVAGAACVAAYVSVGREPGTGPLLHALLDRGTRVLLPVLVAGSGGAPGDPYRRDLDWAEYTGPDDLRPASRGLLEPTGPLLGPDAVRDVQVVLVPGLAADRTGARLGRGGGSYDRTLHTLRLPLAGHRPPWTCLLLHAGELLDLPVPTAAHDVAVEAAATPSGLHRLQRARSDGRSRGTGGGRG